MRKRLWSPEEDEVLKRYVEQHGSRKWKEVAAQSGLNRCAKSCRLRWVNYLRPGLKCNAFSPLETCILLRLHKHFGNKWTKIMSYLPGRSDNDIKNFWHTYQRRQRCKSLESSPRLNHKNTEIDDKKDPLPSSANYELNLSMIDLHDHMGSKEEMVSQAHMRIPHIYVSDKDMQSNIPSNNMESKMASPSIENERSPEGLHLVVSKFMNPKQYVNLIE